MSRSVWIAFAIVVVGSIITAARPDGDRHRSRDFHWESEVAPGSWVRLRNLNGPVTVEPSSDGKLSVRAKQSWRGGDADGVRVEMERAGDEFVFCGMYGPGGVCEEGGEYRTSTHKGSWWRRGPENVNIAFTVEVPAGVKVDAKTANGPVHVEGMSSDVTARTTNGSIRAETRGGALRAQTVNGSIRARIDSLRAGGDIELETVNGSVTAALPTAIDADLELSTVNGRIQTEYPITVSGDVSSKRIRAVLGAGGPDVRVRTVNGRITLDRVQ